MWHHMALAAYSVSPSPNPLPLGEGFSLGGGLGFVVMAPGFVMRGRGARPGAPTLFGNQRHITPPNPPVIPAKAGIHPPAFPQFGANRGSGFRPAPE